MRTKIPGLKVSLCLNCLEKMSEHSLITSSTVSTDVTKIRDLYMTAAEDLKRGLQVDLSDQPMTDTQKKEYEEIRNRMAGNLESVLGRLEGLTTTESSGNESQSNESSQTSNRTGLPNKTSSNLNRTFTKEKRPSLPEVPSMEAPASFCRTPISNIPSSGYSSSRGGCLSSTLPRQPSSLNSKPKASVKPTPIIDGSLIRKPIARTTSDRNISKPSRNLLKKPILPPTKEVGALSLNLPGFDHTLIQQIMDNIVEKTAKISIGFEDIAGQETAKQALREMIVLPNLNPDLFQGLLSPPKGLLLFGPPGNGKTLLAKAVAAKTDSTFLCITASTLTSKWVGEGEKLVKALFAVARKLQPSVIFVDEIDSILRERKDTEHEASRRLKTEFFIEMDGVKNDSSDRIIIIGATNRPQELDDAILRRFSKRIYVGLPDFNARITLLKNLMSSQANTLSEKDLKKIANMTEKYSGSDLTGLAKEAALYPVRELTEEQLKSVDRSSIRGIRLSDFVSSLKSIRPSLTPESLESYHKFNEQFGVCLL